MTGVRPLLLSRLSDANHLTADVAAIARDAYDLENKVIGTLGAGRIGYRVLQRLLPFDPKELLYCQSSSLPALAFSR